MSVLHFSGGGRVRLGWGGVGRGARCSPKKSGGGGLDAHRVRCPEATGAGLRIRGPGPPRGPLRRSGQRPADFLRRHARGDWGDVGGHDPKAHWLALREGGRPLSTYMTRIGDRLRLLTEPDRTYTTLLPPEEEYRTWRIDMDINALNDEATRLFERHGLFGWQFELSARLKSS